jgi:hypothetical protein
LTSARRHAAPGSRASAQIFCTDSNQSTTLTAIPVAVCSDPDRCCMPRPARRAEVVDGHEHSQQTAEGGGMTILVATAVTDTGAARGRVGRGRSPAGGYGSTRPRRRPIPPGRHPRDSSANTRSPRCRLGPDHRPAGRPRSASAARRTRSSTVGSCCLLRLSRLYGIRLRGANDLGQPQYPIEGVRSDRESVRRPRRDRGG